MSDHQHQYLYVGVRYCDGANPLPGSGSRRRYYAHVYYCTRCLETRGEPIDDPHSVHNSYALEFGATPGSADQCGVPKYDRC